MWISYIEIITFEGLEKFVDSNHKSADGILNFFSTEGISKLLQRELEK